MEAHQSMTCKYSRYHTMLALASIGIAMVMTEWGSYGDGTLTTS